MASLVIEAAAETEPRWSIRTKLQIEGASRGKAACSDLLQRV
jgi:hypothetical protein